MWRQGDVLIRQIHALPNAATLKVADGVLARGEATGHAHRVTGKAVLFRDPESQRLYMRVMGTATIEHEEHAAITLGRGIYEVIGQREYVPEGIQLVSD